MQAREEHVRLRLSHTAHELLPQQPLLHPDRRQRVLEQVALRRLRRAEHGELVEKLLQPLTKLAVLAEHQRPHTARRLQRSLPGPHRRGLHTEALSVELSRLPHHLHPPLGLLLGAITTGNRAFRASSASKNLTRSWQVLSAPSTLEQVTPTPCSSTTPQTFGAPSFRSWQTR